METFPVISRRGSELHNPIVGDFDDTMAQNPTIRSISDGGYVKTRARFTRISRKWTIKYNWMTRANKNTVKTFEDARQAGSEAFTWPNPSDSTSYTVRFLSPITYIAHQNTNYLWWMVGFVLEEV